MKITALLPEHWPAVKAIYEAGLATGNASFQTGAPSWEEWDTAHLSHSRLIALDEVDVDEADVDEAGVDKVDPATAGVIAWAALTPVSGRCVYSGVAEVSIYVDPEKRGQGIGEQLLHSLILESEKNGIWTLQSGIFPENTASLRIHEKNGFRQIGIREKIGRMNGIWRDTVLLERRSKVIGVL